MNHVRTNLVRVAVKAAVALGLTASVAFGSLVPVQAEEAGETPTPTAATSTLDADATATTLCEPDPRPGFVYALNGEFCLNGRPFKHVGANSGGLPYAQSSQVIEHLDRLRNAGVRQVRLFLPNDAYSVEEMGNRLAYVLDQAAARNMYVTVTLASMYGTDVWPWESRGGFGAVPGDQTGNSWCTPTGPGNPADARGFYTRSIQEGGHILWLLDNCWVDTGYTLNYKPFVERIVSRFRDHKAIFGWDITNEQNVSNSSDAWLVDRLTSFYTTMAAFINGLDQNHMITTGMISTGSAWSGMNDTQRDAIYGSSNVDYVTVHEYDADNEHSEWDDIWRANNRWRKPVSVEEVGMRSARTDYTTMQAYVRNLYYGLPLCTPSTGVCATYGSVDSISQWGVEFHCNENFGPPWGLGDSTYGPCAQSRISEYEALSRDWSKRLDSYNEFPSGLIVDNYNFNNDRGASASASANWTPSKYYPTFWASGYQVATAGHGTEDGFRFSFYMPAAGWRTIDAWWTPGTSRTTAAAYVVRNSAGGHLGTAYANQQVNGGRWNTLGTYYFSAGWNSVTLSRVGGATNQHVIADSVRIR